jgi:hypothetical protein
MIPTHSIPQSEQGIRVISVDRVKIGLFAAISGVPMFVVVPGFLGWTPHSHILMGVLASCAALTFVFGPFAVLFVFRTIILRRLILDPQGFTIERWPFRSRRILWRDVAEIVVLNTRGGRLISTQLKMDPSFHRGRKPRQVILPNLLPLKPLELKDLVTETWKASVA